MMKKTLYLLILAALILCGTDIRARQNAGQWTLLPTTGDISEIIETGDRTYFLCGHSLFSLDKDGEFYTYNTTNKLTDNSISGIRYNPEGHYLAIAYNNGNIDLLHDDGSVVNMAEIKDAVLSGSHQINDMAFGNGRIYVATDFGLVVYDEKKHIVLESGIYNQPIDNVMSVDGDRIAIVTDHGCHIAPSDIRHNQLDKFERIGSVWASKFVPVNKSSYLYIHTEGKVYYVTISPDGPSTSPVIIDTGGLPATSAGRSSDGAYFTYGDKICHISATDGSMRTATLPQELSLPAFAATGLESVWATGNDGLSNLNLSGDTPTVISQGFTPEGVSTDSPIHMRRSADGSRLYIGNITVSLVIANAIGDGFNDITRLSYIEDGSIHNALPREISIDHNVFNESQSRNNTKQLIGGSSRFCVDPDDKEIIYVPTRLAGLFVIKNGEVLNVINSTNSPTKSSDWGNGRNVEEIMLADIDRDGNLWIMEETNGNKSVRVLPSAKRKDKIKDVTVADWTSFDIPQNFNTPYRDIAVTFCKKSNINFIYHSDYQNGILVMDNNGTPSNFRDDKFMMQTSFTDASGSQVNTDHITCITEDADGKIWIGTTIGLFVIDKAADAMSPTLTVRRPIVPRNDGTQLGDYLLSTETIYDITIDPSNRKWVATESSGIYLVSADGTEILQNFTTDNSPLPDNCVYSVDCDMSSNKVYIGSAGATLVYDSDSSPAAEDFSEVYAYPNPVRPDYGGWITVTGLMDGSLVKIADAAGNVFFQGTSEGGMITWDGCDSSGNRVRSGIYFVFASRNGEGSSGAVTKIMVIN